MNRTMSATDFVENAANQFGVQHLAVPNDVGFDVSRMESPQVAVGNRSICSPPEPVEVATDQTKFGRAIAEVSLCAALLLGTGSARQDITWMPVKRATATRHAADNNHPLMVTTPSRALAVIRTAFPLQISQIAEILGVSRPTVYAWIGDEQQPQPRCQERLKQIYSLAEYWNARSNLPVPASFMIAPDPAGRSLIDMLESEVIHHREVQSRLDALRASQEDVDSTSIAALARKYGINLESNTENIGEFDVITRRPMNEA